MFDFKKIFKKNKRDAMLIALTSLSLRHIYEDQKEIFDICMEDMKDLSDNDYIIKFFDIVKEVDNYDTHIINTFVECEKIISHDIKNNYDKQNKKPTIQQKKSIKKWW